jgi:hypothetical protein
LCELISLRVAIATSCDAVSSRNRQDLIHSLVPPHYVCNKLSNISIKTNFKQIARVELKCVQYSEGDYILCMTSRYLFRSFTNVRLLWVVSHSNGMTSCQSSSGRERLVQRRAILLSPHLVSDTLYQTGDFR